MKNSFQLLFSVFGAFGRRVYVSEFESPYEGFDWFLRHAMGKLPPCTQFRDKTLEPGCYVHISSCGVEYGVFKFNGHCLAMF